MSVCRPSSTEEQHTGVNILLHSVLVNISSHPIICTPPRPYPPLPLSSPPETVADAIKAAATAAGIELADPEDIADATSIASFDAIIAGAPTWHTDADSERSGTAWDNWLYDDLPGMDLKGKKVAVFGVGDQNGYSDNYCDAAGELYDRFKDAGCEMVGFTSTEGFEHTASKAEVGGKFVGAMFDEDNQYDLTPARAAKWVTQLQGEGLF